MNEAPLQGRRLRADVNEVYHVFDNLVIDAAVRYHRKENYLQYDLDKPSVELRSHRSGTVNCSHWSAASLHGE